MIDPRDQTRPNEDLLTEDSEDEMKDLLKEFEARYNSLKQKRREKLARSESVEKEENEEANVAKNELVKIVRKELASKELKRPVVVKQELVKPAVVKQELAAAIRITNGSRTDSLTRDVSQKIQKANKKEIPPKTSKDPVLEVTGSPPRKIPTPRIALDNSREKMSGSRENLAALLSLTKENSATLLPAKTLERSVLNSVLSSAANLPNLPVTTTPTNVTNIATNFLTKLYKTSTNTPKSSINYNNRKFSLTLPTPQSLDVDEIEPVTRQHLRKRYVSQKDLDHLLTDVKLLRVDKLLAKVHRTNDYAEPEYTNWCFCGVVLKKFDPQTSRDGKHKWMKVSVGDFSRSVELMLFEEAFSAYWKLRLGDVVYILNPLVSKYSFGTTSGPAKTGFTLKLADHNVGSVVEVGACRDYGVCSAVKKDGSTCGDVVNTKKATLCEYHMEERYRGGNKRMELNGSVQMREPGRPGGQFSHQAHQKHGQNGQNGKNYGQNGQNRQYAGQFNQFGGHFTTYNEQTQIFGSESSFSKAKYDDPRALITAADKRRRLNDQKAKEALEERLRKHSSQHKTAERLNLLPTKVVDGQKLADGKNRLFPNGMISKIGFDPTVTLQASLQPHTKKQELARVRELNELSSSMSAERNLASSSEDQRHRSDLWKKNVRDRKEYKRKVGESWGRTKEEEMYGKASETTNRATNKLTKKFTKPTNETTATLSQKFTEKSRTLGRKVETELDSDSDIDIDFGERAKEYQERINKLQGR